MTPSSQGCVATLASGRKLRSTVVNEGASGHNLVEGVGEGLVDIVVDTRLVMETSRLPELWHVRAGPVVVIKNELTGVANDPQSEEVSLTSNVEGTSGITRVLGIALIIANLLEAVPRAVVGQLAIG